MKFAALLCTFIASVAVTASVVPEIQARDTCGPGFGGDQRRTNSFCNASNGRKIFCGCDRTDLVMCQAGRWIEIGNCGTAICHGGNDGGGGCRL